MISSKTDTRIYTRSTIFPLYILLPVTIQHAYCYNSGANPAHGRRTTYKNLPETVAIFLLLIHGVMFDELRPIFNNPARLPVETSLCSLTSVAAKFLPQKTRHLQMLATSIHTCVSHRRLQSDSMVSGPTVCGTCDLDVGHIITGGVSYHHKHRLSLILAPFMDE